MEEDDEFGDLYSDVLQPFQPPVVLPPPPPLPHRSIDLNLRSQDQDVSEPNSAPISRVSDNDAVKLSTQDATRQAIVDGGGDDKDMSFDIEEPDADSTPTIPGLFVTGALPGLATDRGVSQVTTRIEQQVGGGGDGGYGGQGEGDDWDSDSEDDLQIVLNDSSRNVMIGGADRRSRMGDNEDDDDEDDEDPLVIVADTDPNQPMEEQMWGEDGLQGIEGDGKDGGEAGKGSGPGGATGPPKAGYSSHGYHPFHSQFKYVRPGAAPIPGGAASVGGPSSGQVRPPANLGPMAGRGRGDWRPLGMRNASAAQKGFHQPWGSNTAGRGLDFTLPSHKTIFEVDIDSFEEKPWRYPGVEMTDYFNFGLNEESWKDYCKQLDQHRIQTTMQSRIRVYESGRTDQGYDPDLPPELAAATGAQGVPVDSSNLVKPDSVQGDSAKVPANVRPTLPPGRPIPVETGSGERLPSIDTRAPRMRDLDAIIEIVCQDSHEDEPSGENGTDQADSSLPGENVPVETSYVNNKRPDTESAEHSPAQDEPHKNLLKKQDDEISRSTDSGQSFRSSSPVGDRGTRSSSVDREDVGGEAGKDAEMGEELKMSFTSPQSAVQEDDGGESKTERSSESSKARSGSHRDFQQEEDVIQDKHSSRPANNRKQYDNNAPHQSRKNQDRGKEMERTRAASKGGRENSNPHMELDSTYIYSIASREDFDKRKERDVDGAVWRRKEDDPYSRRGGDEGSRKRDREDDPGFRQRGKMRENEIRSKDDQVPSRKHMDDAGMRNIYEPDDHINKRRKDEEYLRRSRPEKNEISYGQRESMSRVKRERDDRLEHQKRDVQHKIRDDFDDHGSLRQRDDIYMQRDGNERLRERDVLDKLKLPHEDGISARGRERQVAVRGHRGSEDRSSRMKDEYKASDKEHVTKDTLRHAKQTKRRDYPGEESSSHHRGHEDFSARTDNIVNNEKKPRQERTGAKIDKFIDTLDGQRLQDRKHKDSRRKIKEQREGTESLSKQGEQNGSSVVTGSKGTNDARNCRSEIPHQPNTAKRHKENASSGDEIHDSKRGRTKLERWASHKEREDAVSAKSSSISSKLEEKENNTNGRLSEPVHGSIGKSRDVTEEKIGHDLADTKDGSEKGPGDRHLDTVATIEVRYESLKVVAECEVVEGKALPTLWNTAKRVLSELVKLTGAKTHEAKINIINDVNGIIKPGRLTLLLGPPSCGKTTLLKALSGNLENNLKCSGEISYNGHRLDEFVPQKTSAYISQYDLHIAEMTVRETVDFSARCQGVGSRTDIMMEVSKREKEKGIIPDTEVDAYMKAISVEGLQRSLQTDYILKILGLDICAEILIGDVMRRGISGGQKKRLTTAEMIVGPTKALFMDEITNGLDSSTAFQIVKSLQQFAHISSATVLVSLLQPAPESYDLFDDIMLMAKGRIVYHGPRGEVLNFFEDCGFRCPERKGVADFLQEVISKKDQAQYWWHEDLPYSFVSVEMLSKKFKDLSIGKKIEDTLSKPYDRSKSHKDALSFSVYSLPNWELFIACISREYLLMKRNYFVYIFKTAQLVMAAFITMTVFIRTRMGIDIIHGNSYMSALFFALIILLVDGFPELSMTAQRLAVFYKQKQLCFYPAWAYAIPATVLKVPLSFFESLVWTCLSYYVIGYTPEASRFFKQFILLFAVHFTSISMFRCLAAIFQTVVASITAGSFGILFTFVFAGFVIPPPSMPAWLKWGFWANPLSYGEIGLSVNEFLAPRWNQMQPNNFTLGRTILQTRGMDYNGYMYWVSLCALLGFTVLFNIIFTLALTFLKSPTSSRAMISQDKLSELQGTEKSTEDSSVRKKTTDSPVKTEEEDKMVLPFKPLTVTFQDLNYFVDMPVEMRDQGYDQKKLQLLSDITGAFRPGILTALMGVSGAGKTTLLDVLAGRKTSGYIEGDIRISGFPKVQETFARVSGYCEQTDIHSPNITVEESVIYSAWLRLAPEIDATTKTKFVKQVLETIELDEIKDSLVGVTGVSGLSTEQRKRLTIAVELVANPSIIFMDEPTTGLDARAAAIVMRAVKNVADTGRTIVCTIHQPSIDIFEAFDELVLLKRGGRMIYTGPLGQHSRHIIEYFESVPEIPKIKDNHNPATWMLDVSSQSVEIELGVDFAKIYHDSALYKRNSELVKQLSQPDSGSSDIQFKRTFAQSWWGQFKSILWKMNLSYWRSPSYNLMRMMHTLVSSLIFGALFWKQGQNLDTQQSMFTVFGAIYGLVLFLGINNCASALQYFETERNVMYRERFAGMYSATAYALGQVVTEIPYIFIQAAEFVIVTYPMIGFYPSAYKVFWSLYSMFCSLLTFNYLAMFLVSITPNFMVAAILQSLFYVGFNLFSGFLIPQTQVPGWWIWLYYLTPTSWTLNGFISSQYGDIHEEINVFGQSTTVARFLKDYFGFHHDLLAVTAVVQIAFPIALASMFAFFVGKLNFQRR